MEPVALSARACFRQPIQQIFEAANKLDQAVSAHLEGDTARAGQLIAETNLEVIRDWTESLWGKNSPYRGYRPVADAPPYLAKSSRVPKRMPNAAERQALHERDGYHCRFCGIPVIRAEIRRKIHKAYPDDLPWGRRNIDQHAAFQAMWLQYDHLLPHCRGGDNSLTNVIVTCAPCNYCRMDYTLEEVGLVNPLTREPVRDDWGGVECFKIQ